MASTVRARPDAAAGHLSRWLRSQLVGVETRLRERLLRAEGRIIYTADAVTDTRDPRLRPVAERLAGAALVRFSAALWASREWPDVLGLALRFFGRPKVRPESPALQDVLLVSAATSLAGLPLALTRTDPHDFLANQYHGLAAFEADGIGRVRARARWPTPSPSGRGRFDRLMAAVVTDCAVLSFELRPEDASEWSPLLRVRLRVPAALDERRSRFTPFNDRGGLRATGLLHAIRRRGHVAGQRARGAPASGTTPTVGPSPRV